MAESCMVCGEKMYVGEAFDLSTPTGKHLGFVHRTCFYGESIKEDPKKGNEICKLFYVSVRHTNPLFNEFTSTFLRGYYVLASCKEDAIAKANKELDKQRLEDKDSDLEQEHFSEYSISNAYEIKCGIVGDWYTGTG